MVFVQSRATAHVYRMFGALVILLLLMALAVAFTRLRLDQRAASPYGGLAAVSSSAAPTGSAVPPAAAVPAAIAPPTQSAIATAASPAPRPEATPVPHALAPAAIPPLVAQTAPTPPVAQAPGPAPAATGAPLASTVSEADADARRGGTRQIALGKADVGAAPQPAPAALVAAATRAANEPARPARPSPAPERVAALTPPAEEPSSSGRININTASADQLNEIGAGHIGRTIVRHRPYRSLEDLVAHRVLTARDFARIRAAISVD